MKWMETGPLEEGDQEKHKSTTSMTWALRVELVWIHHGLQRGYMD